MRSFLIALFFAAAIPTAAADTLSEIWGSCKAQWPRDYRMQEYCINKQVESWNSVATINRNARGDERDMLGRCLSQWQQDWRMVEYCFKKQNEAYYRLRSAEPPIPGVVGVPDHRTKPQRSVRKQRTGHPGTVIGLAKVVDGDTLVIGAERVRIRGIDAPELSQDCVDAWDFRYPCGEVAAKALKGLLAEQEIRCDFVSWDAYGRYVGDCYLKDNSSLGAWLVENGYALDWAASSKGDYLGPQASAKAKKVGVWAGDFTEPWTWRDERNRDEQSVEAPIFDSYRSEGG